MQRTFTLFFLLLFLLSPTRTLYAQWEFKHPATNYFSDASRIFVRDKNTAFIVCDGPGRLLRTGDGGKTWQERYLSNDFSWYVTDMRFPDNRHVWASNFDGNIYHSVDGGDTWERLYFGNGVASMTFDGPENGWILSKNGYLRRTRDGGKTWETTPTNLKYVMAVGGKKLLGKLDSGITVCSVDEGRTWTPIHDLYGPGNAGTHSEKFFYSENCNRIEGYALNGTGLYSLKEREFYDRYSNYGTPEHYFFSAVNPSHAWTGVLNDLSFISSPGVSTKLPFSGYVNSLGFFDQRNGLIYADNYIYESHDGGNTWQELFAIRPTRETFADIHFVDDREGYAVSYNSASLNPGFESRLYQTNDGGNSWQLRYSDPVYTYGSVYASAGKILVCTYGGYLLEFGKQAGPPVITPLIQGALYEINFFTASSGLLTGQKGALMRTTDAGETWSTISLSDSGYFKLCVVKDGKTAVISSKGHIYRSLDMGLNWQKIPLPDTALQPTALYFMNKDTGVVSAYIFTGTAFNYSLFFTNDGGLSWKQTGMATTITGGAIESTVESLYMDDSLLLVGKTEGLYSRRKNEIFFTREFIRTYASVMDIEKKPNGDIFCLSMSSILKRENMKPFGLLLPGEGQQLSAGASQGVGFSWDKVGGAYEYTVIFRSEDSTVQRSCSDFLRLNDNVEYRYHLDAGQAVLLAEQLQIPAGGTRNVTWSVWAINARDTVKSAESSFSFLHTVPETILPAPLFMLVPNPANKEVWVALPFKVKTDLRISLYDAQGKMVQAREISRCDCGDFQLDISALSQGVYFVRLEYEGKVSTEKLVIYR